MIDKADSLSTLLWNFSKQIIENVQKKKDQGIKLKTPTLYLKKKVEELTFQDGRPTSRFSQKYVTIEAVDPGLWALLQAELAQLPLFDRCVEAIVKVNGEPESLMMNWLFRFTQAIASSALNSPDDAAIVDRITTFIGDVHNNPTEWNITLHLQGLRLDAPKYNLADDILLRQPTAADLEWQIPLDLIGLYESHIAAGLPSAILGFRIQG